MRCESASNPWWQGSWGLHGAHLGPTGPRWAPCWPHDPCYLGGAFDTTSVIGGLKGCPVYIDSTEITSLKLHWNGKMNILSSAINFLLMMKTKHNVLIGKLVQCLILWGVSNILNDIISSITIYAKALIVKENLKEICRTLQSALCLLMAQLLVPRAGC